MSLHESIRDRIKTAMKEKNQVELDTLRGLLSACTNEAVALKRSPQDMLSDEEVLVVIKRLVKQRKDSIEQFRAGGREDLATEEEAQLSILAPFLPEQMSYEEVREFTKTKLEELSITDKTKMGQAVGMVMKDLKDRADGGDVKRAVEELLG